MDPPQWTRASKASPGNLQHHVRVRPAQSRHYVTAVSTVPQSTSLPQCLFPDHTGDVLQVPASHNQVLLFLSTIQRLSSQ